MPEKKYQFSIVRLDTKTVIGHTVATSARAALQSNGYNFSALNDEVTKKIEQAGAATEMYGWFYAYDLNANVMAI